MPLRISRLGTPRHADEGLRLGTVRRPPRGVRREDFARRDYFDLWMPDLAPSAPLVKWALSEPWTDARWQKYARSYLREMQQKPQQRLIKLVAAMSHTANLSVGCYCADETRCHRTLLRALLEDAGACMANNDSVCDVVRPREATWSHSHARRARGTIERPDSSSTQRRAQAEPAQSQ